MLIRLEFRALGASRPSADKGNALRVQNVLTQGNCELETQGRTLPLSEPRLIHDPQRGAMPPMVRVALGVLNVSDFLELVLSNDLICNH